MFLESRGVAVAHVFFVAPKAEESGAYAETDSTLRSRRSLRWGPLRAHVWKRRDRYGIPHCSQSSGTRPLYGSGGGVGLAGVGGRVAGVRI
jgi:hypothetical protein